MSRSATASSTTLPVTCTATGHVPAGFPIHPQVARLLQLAEDAGYAGEEDSEILYALGLADGSTLLVWEGNNYSGIRGNAVPYLIPATADLSELVDAVNVHGFETFNASLCLSTALGACRIGWSGTLGIG